MTKQPKSVISESFIMVGDFKIRVYVCDDGERYLNADDVESLFNDAGTDGLYDMVDEIKE